MAHYELTLLRKTEIEDTLLAMMQEIPCEQITVKNLTDKLTIARKTFYHYYSSKQACLESLIDRIILECNLQRMALPQNTLLEDIYREQLLFWMQHRAFLTVIIRDNLSSLLIERIQQYIQQEDTEFLIRLNTAELSCDEDILLYYISGQVSLLLKWCREDFSCPMEEMVRKIIRLSYKPLLSGVPEP